METSLAKGTFAVGPVMLSIFLTRATGLSIRTSSSVGARPSRLEEEIISLFQQLRAPLLRYLVSSRIPPADAEEIIQEVFLLLFQHMREGKPCPQPRGWVFKAAHNYALKFRTKAQREIERFGTAAQVPEVVDSLTPGPEQRIQDLQHRSRLLAVVRALPEQDQCCLSLRAEGLRYRDIATTLGISLGAVANSLERSLSRLARASGYSR
jgi:RNA polymerase sigma-70 factor, ECF subfamily